MLCIKRSVGEFFVVGNRKSPLLVVAVLEADNPWASVLFIMQGKPAKFLVMECRTKDAVLHTDDGDIEVRLTGVNGKSSCTFGITAPKEIVVSRGERKNIDAYEKAEAR